MGTNRMKSEDRRAAILREAIRLFAEKGFRGTTTRELAAAVGVTEPVLYQHFQTKKDLYTAIIEAKAAEAFESGKQIVSLADSADDWRFLTTIGNTILQYYENDPDLIRLLLFSSMERHELSDLFFDRLVVNFFELVSGYVKRRQKEGAFRKLNPDAVARALIGVFAYQGLMGLLHPGRFGRSSRKKLVTEIATVFLEGVRAPGATERLHA